MDIRRSSAIVLIVAAGVVLLAPAWLGATGEPTAMSGDDNSTPGTLTIEFDQRSLDALGWAVLPDGAKDASAFGNRVTFPIRASSGLRPGDTAGVLAGSCRAAGALLFEWAPERIIIGNLDLSVDADGAWIVSDTLDDRAGGVPVFFLSSVMVDVLRNEREIRVVGELSLTESWARELGVADASGMAIGVMTVETALVDGWDDTGGSQPDGRDVDPITTGPDIVVATLQSVARFGRLGDITAYAIGTTACNYGDERASWVNTTNEHPVIAQAIYRLKDDRFEQIGLSWVKHGFYALSEDYCGLGCPDPTMGQELGVGCSDPYMAPLNGAQSNMALRSDVDAHTGYFPYPWSAPPWDDLTDKRIQVRDIDLRPSDNVGAEYFLEGQYIAADDAAAGNGNNNATYRRAIVTHPQPILYDVQPDTSSASQIGQAAIRAWQDFDTTVVETEVQVPDDGLFIVASKAVPLPDGFRRFEYAVQNLNSDRSARSFSIPLPAGASVRLTGFKDVGYHSGEVFDSTDWLVTVTADSVTWSTESEDVDPNANALRFGTLYNFWLETDAEPKPTIAAIGLFKAGSPDSVPVATIGLVGMPRPLCDGSFDIDRAIRLCTSDADCLDGLSATSQTYCVLPSGEPGGEGTCYVQRNRYISIDPNPDSRGIPTARRVSLETGGGNFVPIGWVGEPVQTVVAGPETSPQLLARVEAIPYFRDWHVDDEGNPWADASVHLGDCEISPGHGYRVDAIPLGFDIDDEANYSDGLLLRTTDDWADVVGAAAGDPPDGVRNFRDISAVVAGFQSIQSAPKTWLDLQGGTATPELPDFSDVSFTDINHTVAGFQGADYPFSLPCECPGQSCP